MEDAAKFIEALSHLIGVMAWPVIVVFLVFRFGSPVREFIANLGEGSFKGFGLEATAKRRAEAVAAIVAAQAESKSKGSQVDTAGISLGAAKIAQSFADSVKVITSRAIRSSENKIILWVDDNPENNNYEKKAFVALGFRVLSLRSTEEALRFISDNREVDVVISDMKRPEGDRAGYDLLRSLRKSGLDVPFIIYSSSNTYGEAVEAKENGAFGSTTDAGRLTKMVLDAVK